MYAEFPKEDDARHTACNSMTRAQRIPDLDLTLEDIKTLPLGVVCKEVARATNIIIQNVHDWDNAFVLVDHVRDLSDGHVALTASPSGWQCYFGKAEAAAIGLMPAGKTPIEAICRGALCALANVDPTKRIRGDIR